jgi:L-ascorbate metabolism protein UlaG (beta-lactamase superfamily)
MKVIYYGHASFGIEINGVHLLFDPFITPNELAKDIDINTIPADYILISHGHEDHVADVESIAKRTGATIVSNYEIVSWFGTQGINNGHPMNHGGSWSFDFGTVKYVNAIHSSVLPDGTYGGNPGGFIVKTDGKALYYAGDTALTYDMKLIGDQENIDLAFLPIGNNFTMGIEDAVIATGFVNCDHVIPMHYDTFGYIEINKEDAMAKFSNASIQLSLMEIGQVLEF